MRVGGTHTMVRDGENTLSVLYFNQKCCVISDFTAKWAGLSNQYCCWFGKLHPFFLHSLLQPATFHCNEYNWAWLGCYSIIQNKPEIWSNILNADMQPRIIPAVTWFSWFSLSLTAICFFRFVFLLFHTVFCIIQYHSQICFSFPYFIWHTHSQDGPTDANRES